MKQQSLYEPVKEWLESQGFKALVVGTQSKIVVPVADLLPSRVYLVPDVVGVKDNQVAIVEAETSLDKAMEVIGKCMVWKACATFVYAAYPLEKCHRFRVLEKLGVGLLGVSGKEVKEVVKMMPDESSGLLKVLELHPLDFSREMDLAHLIKRMLGVEE